MGVLEAIAAIATAVTAIIGVVYFALEKAKQAKHEKYVIAERELSEAIKNAKTNEDRRKLSEALHTLRSRI
jgi:hypothetical protein